MCQLERCRRTVCVLCFVKNFAIPGARDLTVANEDLRDRIRQAIKRQERPTVTVLSSLLATQDEVGYIPREAIEEIAAYTGASTNDVWGVASFYKNFHFTEPNEHVIEICWGPSCHIVGAPEIIQEAAEALGIEGEGDSSDGKATLRYNTCLGACARAPVISIDHQLYGRMTAKKAVEKIKSL